MTDEPRPQTVALGPPTRRRHDAAAADAGAVAVLAPVPGPSGDATPAADGVTRTAVSLSVGGMTCGACAARVERHLNGIEGVHAQVNYATERATVHVPPSLGIDRLLAEVAAIGYTAELVGSDPRRVATGSAEEAARRTRALGRRLLVAAILFMPLCDTSIAFSVVPTVRFPGWQWLLLVLAAPVVTWAAWPFHAAAARHARHGTSTMDTLVSLGVVAATAWSVYAMFFEDTTRTGHSVAYLLSHASGGSIYLDVAGGVTTFLLAGRYFEARSRQRSGDALRALAELGAKDVAVVGPDGTETRRPVTELVPGDRFVVRPGETVATDGQVVDGEAAIDRSLMTGESEPVDVGPGDSVTGGTVSLTGRLVVQATSVGADTQLGHMLALVERAQNDKAKVQRLADRVSAVFVPVVIVLALATLGGWLLSGASTLVAFNAGLSVLIIACPCALGLATPAALFVASGAGARLGIFFKGYQALEASRQIDTVVLDKTGTITEGRMVVVGCTGLDGVDHPGGDQVGTGEADETGAAPWPADAGCRAVVAAAASLEAASEHPIARAIVGAASAAGIAPSPVTAFSALAGLGATGTVGTKAVSVGRAVMAPEPLPPPVAARCAQWEAAGRTAVVVRVGGAVVGALAVADAVRPSAAPAVARFRALGLRCILLSGDNEPTARAVAAAVGIDEVVAGAVPDRKVAVIRELQSAGRTVAMVGDGINDGPALATADLGLAVGSGTDVAINAADLIIVRDDLTVAAAAVELARRTLRTIRANLVWAFAYNMVAIPVAASGLLDPLIAGGAMALSSVFVVWNSSRLRRPPGRPAAQAAQRPRPPAARRRPAPRRARASVAEAVGG